MSVSAADALFGDPAKKKSGPRNAAGQSKEEWQAQNPGTDSTYFVDENPYQSAMTGAQSGSAWNAQGMKDLGARLDSGSVDLGTGAGTSGIEDWNQLRALGGMRDQPWLSKDVLSTYTDQQLDDVGISRGAWDQTPPADDPATIVSLAGGGSISAPGGKNGLGVARQRSASAALFGDDDGSGGEFSQYTGDGYDDGSGVPDLGPRFSSSTMDAPPPLPPPPGGGSAPPPLPPPPDDATTGFQPPPPQNSGAQTGFRPPAPTSTAVSDPRPGASPTGGNTAVSGGARPSPTPTSSGSASTGTGPSGLLSTPGAYEQWIKDNVARLGVPTAVETLFGSGAASGLSTSTISMLSQMTPGQLQEWVAEHGNDLASPGASERLFGDLSSGPTNSQTTLNAHGGDLSGKGYTENLYESGIGQLDPFYDYASKRAIQSAQTASAARNRFNSGVSAQQESDILGNLRGQQAKEWVTLAPQADAEKQARINALFAEAGSTDAANLGRDNSRITAARNSDLSATDRFKTSAAAAGDAEAARLAEWNANRGLANDQDSRTANNIKQLFDIAGMSDSSALGRLGAEGALTKDLQATGEDRLTKALSAISGLDARESGLAERIFGDMSSVNELDATWLQAEADKYGISLQQMKDIVGALGDAASIAVGASGKK